MKTSWQVRTLLLAGCISLLTPLASAWAAGTAANTPVSNQATLDYQVGGVGQPQILSDDDGIPGNGQNPTVFVVDNRVDLTMTGGTRSVTPGSTGQILVFSVSNTGNATQGYALDLATGLNATDDQFDMTGVTVYLDNNKDGLVDGGDTVYVPNAGNRIADVPANSGAASTIQVLVVADTPLTATNGQTARYTLKAKTLNAGTTTETTATPGADNPAVVDVVLADGNAGAGVGGATDGLQDGDFLATGTYTVQDATLAITKSVAVISDPINGVTNPKAIPGATVRYSIAITNSGPVAATNVVLTDTIPTNTDFLVGSVTDSTATGTIDYSNGAFGYAPVGAAGAADPAVVAVRVSIPNVAALTGSATVTFDVTIE